MRKFLLISAIVVLSLILLVFGTDLVLLNVNHKKNVEAWQGIGEPTIIYDQHEYEDIKYGAGNIAKNGCGPCSIYNILYLDDRYVALPDIIKNIYMFGNIGLGLAGARPSAVIDVLKQYGYEVRYYFDTKKFEDLAKSSRYVIYLYVGKTKSGTVGHYQLMTDYNEEIGDYQLYSPYYRTIMQNLLDYSKCCFVKMLITVN